MIKDNIELIKENLSEIEDQLLNMAFQLTGNLMDARSLLGKTKENLFQTKEFNHDNILNFRWFIFREMKHIYLMDYLRSAEFPGLIDHTNDCYLILNNNEVIEVNDSVSMMNKIIANPFRMFIDGYDIDVISDKLNMKENHIREKIEHAQDKIEKVLHTAIERYKPKFIIVWNFKIYEHLNALGNQGENHILPDETTIETRVINHDDGTKTKIFPIKHHKAGLSPVFWHKAIISFMKKGNDE